ncbi:uncharacterized protein [Rutidosis leptorrhynchoides]|uniref:uncharacterized protein n=1 Tax=Rutidosis leptorrhynchoides TaxID=125765 RepID=UPI003A99AA30
MVNIDTDLFIFVRKINYLFPSLTALFVSQGCKNRYSEVLSREFLGSTRQLGQYSELIFVKRYFSSLGPHSHIKYPSRHFKFVTHFDCQTGDEYESKCCINCELVTHLGCRAGFMTSSDINATFVSSSRACNYTWKTGQFEKNDAGHTSLDIQVQDQSDDANVMPMDYSEGEYVDLNFKFNNGGGTTLKLLDLGELKRNDRLPFFESSQEWKDKHIKGHPIDAECYNLWHASAGLSICVPSAGQHVYYHVKGHRQQMEASMHHGSEEELPDICLPDKILCYVLDVQLYAEPETEQVYAEITLLPVHNRNEIVPIQDPVLPQPPSCVVPFFCHTITEVGCLTQLDASLKPPSRELVAFDIRGNQWRFSHTLEGREMENCMLVFEGDCLRHHVILILASFMLPIMQSQLGPVLQFLTNQEKCNLHFIITRNMFDSTSQDSHRSSGQLIKALVARK